MIQQLLVNGLIAGCTYSLTALPTSSGQVGFALIYQTTRFFPAFVPIYSIGTPADRPVRMQDEVSTKVGHFAHGAVYTFGAYASTEFIPLKAGLTTCASTKFTPLQAGLSTDSSISLARPLPTFHPVA